MQGVSDDQTLVFSLKSEGSSIQILEKDLTHRNRNEGTLRIWVLAGKSRRVDDRNHSLVQFLFGLSSELLRLRV